MSGFIQLSREFFKTKEWRKGRNLSDAEAMLYMISKAGFEAKTELVKGKSIHLQVGELRASERFLAEEWDWSKNKVNRFLERIEQVGYIDRRADQGEGIIRLKRFISSLGPVNGPPNGPVNGPPKRASKGFMYNCLGEELKDGPDHQMDQQTDHKSDQWRTSDGPPINNKEKNKNNENKGRENPPYPPFSEKVKSDVSVESPKKELLPLNTEKEEKEKSCGQKEKEEQGDLKPSGNLDGDLRHVSAQEKRPVTEVASDLKTAPGSADQPARAMQGAKTGFSGVPHQQKLFGELRYPFASEKFTKSWALWKRYKGEEHGFKYKSLLSEQMALNALYKLSQGQEARALSIIEQSMANGWEGLFELKNPGREQGTFSSALEKLRSDQVLFEGFSMKYVSQLTKADFEHFCQQWDLSKESQGGWEEKGKRQLLAGLEKYLNTVIYRKKREEKTEHHAIDIKKSTIRKLG